jgi:membrane associated rhomboid family serine protease
MGIYDRDYYREEKAGILDWLLPAGSVCKALFVIYIGVMLIQLVTLPSNESARPNVAAMIHGRHISAYGGFTDLFDLDVERVLHGEVWRLVTYAFLHPPGAFLTFVFGLLFLMWFGSDLENIYGRAGFAIFYFGSILVASLTYSLVSWWRGELGPPHMWSREVLGALLVLAAIHFPTRVIMMFFIIPVPIWMMAGLYILWNVYDALGGFGAQAFVFSQLLSAGFAVGFYKYKRDFGALLPDAFSGLFRLLPRHRRQLRLYHPEMESPREREPVPVAAPPAGHAVDEHFEAKLDAVLEKIARVGKDKLTADEQEVLVRASELYKKRRS